MWQKAKEWLQNKKEMLLAWHENNSDALLKKTRILIIAVATICILIIFGIGVICVGTAIYVSLDRMNTKPVTTMSQQQAETPSGVQDAADNAGVKLDAGQAKEVSTVIREIRVTEKEPVYIIQTTVENAKVESEKAAKQEQADFAIVTDKNDPEKEVNLEELDKDTKVELNQYNIQAFKKHINTIEYQPTENVVGYTHQWKVTDSGRYMGVGADYDIDDKKIYAKITYSW